MERTRWGVDGALVGVAPGLILVGLLSVGPLLQPQGPAPWKLQSPGAFLLLSTLVGALAGWGIQDAFRLRRLVPAKAAPLLFTVVGFGAGLVVSLLWLQRFAVWPLADDGFCLRIATDEPRLGVERVGAAVAAAWTIGTALWAPVLGVLGLGARTATERAKAVAATWVAAAVAVPLAYGLGAMLTPLVTGLTKLLS